MGGNRGNGVGVTYRRSGRGCGRRKKLSQAEEERLNKLLQMAAISIVGRRRVTVGGLTDTDYFCANLHSEGPS